MPGWVSPFRATGWVRRIFLPFRWGAAERCAGASSLDAALRVGAVDGCCPAALGALSLPFTVSILLDYPLIAS